MEKRERGVHLGGVGGSGAVCDEALRGECTRSRDEGANAIPSAYAPHDDFRRDGT